MDLDLITPRTRGRAPIALQPDVVRPLRREDLALLSSEKGVKAPPIAKLRARHHTLARLLAQGTPIVDCMAITGYERSRISILQGDPTFVELVTYYANLVEEKYLDTHARLGELTTNALEIINEKLETTDIDDISFGVLTELVKLGADRTGHGPTSTQNTNVNVNFANRLEEARKRVAQRALELRANEE